MKRPELKGMRFGRLTVIDLKPKTRGVVEWYARCDCGTDVVVPTVYLTSGNTKSCGCLRRDKSSERARVRNTKHGLRGTPEYLAWKTMRERCYKPTTPNFARYGGRGIAVCDQWRDDPAAFVRDMGLRPSSDHSLDRIDNDGPYSPENCRWATRGEQASNRSNNRYFVIAGTQVTMSEAARAAGMPVQRLYQRLKAGWTLERALATPARKCAR